MTIRILAFSVVVAITTSVAAQAAVLATQPVFVDDGEVFYCKIVNISTKERQVTVEILGSTGSVVDSATSTLEAGGTTALSETGGFENRWCRFIIAGSRKLFRAGASLGDGSSDFFAVPAQ
jgi:hypothetical protein